MVRNGELSSSLQSHPAPYFVNPNPGSSCTVGAPGDNPVGPQCADVCAGAVDMQFVECSTPRHIPLHLRSWILGSGSLVLGPKSPGPDANNWHLPEHRQVTMWATLECWCWCGCECSDSNSALDWDLAPRHWLIIWACFSHFLAICLPLLQFVFWQIRDLCGMFEVCKQHKSSMKTMRNMRNSWSSYDERRVHFRVLSWI